MVDDRQSDITTAIAVDSHSCFIAPTIGADDFGLGGGHSGKYAECDRNDADLRMFHCHWYFFLCFAQASQRQTGAIPTAATQC